jgi:tripartite-type tricarboxylate transporter receptor subunit TctC
LLQAPRHRRIDTIVYVRNPAMNKRRKLIAAIATAPAIAGFPALVRAQSNTPIRILVGFPAGGTIDVVARILADRLKDDLGAPVVVESRVGAGGQLAAQALKAATPDGRTFMIAPDHTMVVVPLTLKDPGYDVARDFAPVGQVARYVGAFAVSASTGVKSFAEYLAWARANPSQANVGIPAPGSKPHFGMLSISRETRVSLTTVPYKGSAPLVQDLLGGQIAAGTTALGDFLEHHAAGRLRIIAVIDPRRVAQVPEVPTFAEQGHKLDLNYWLGMFAPAGTPAPAVERVGAALAKALAQPDIRERMAKMVFEPAAGGAAALGALVQADTRYWEPLVKASGWTLQ